MIPQLKVAQTAVSKASKYIRSSLYTAQWNNLDQKELAKLLDNLRTSVHKKLSEYIFTAYPTHLFAATDQEQAHVWHWDILAETNNFMHKIENLSIVVTCCYKGTVLLCVIANPLYEQECLASKGNGATYNSTRMRTSITQQVEQAIIAAPYLPELSVLFEQVKDLRRLGSISLEMMYLALGRLDGVVYENKLPQATNLASFLLMQESGGFIQQISLPSYPIGDSILAANPQLFSTLNSYLTAKSQTYAISDKN